MLAVVGKLFPYRAIAAIIKGLGSEMENLAPSGYGRPALTISMPGWPVPAAVQARLLSQ